MGESSDDRLRYECHHSDSPIYARVARLLELFCRPGLVVDLGCGVGVLSQPVNERGYGYLGIDVDSAAVTAARTQGIEAAVLDLSDLDAVADDLHSLVGSRVVTAIAMLDVIEHLAQPDRVLQSVGSLIDRFGGEAGAPLLVVSIPNVSHSDLGAKLITGRWDVTEVGLLDDTHITLFTESRLDDVMARAGFVEVGADDNVAVHTEQQFPLDHPAVGQLTLLSRFLRSLRRHTGPAAETYQFVRCYRRATQEEHASLVAALEPRPTGRPSDPALIYRGPLMSVVVRTQGSRSSLVDTLTSLAAQTDQDFEVLLMVHHDDRSRAEQVQRLVDGFEQVFAARVQVVPVSGGGRSRPLNVALAHARGRYLAMVDDGDIVVANWVEAFRVGIQHAPGTIVRAPSLLQWTERVGDGDEVVPVSGFENPFALRFDYLDHVRRNRSPICSYAVPVAAVDALGVDFDESLEALEDWKFLMEMARWLGVTDVAELVDGPVLATSICRQLRDGGGSKGLVGEERWATLETRVAEELAAEPSLLPAGALLKIRHFYDGVNMEVPDPVRSDAIAQRDATIQALTHRVAALERSRVWRWSAPLRRLAGLRSRLARRVVPEE
jgi:SAM-dependent methyltransferase